MLSNSVYATSFTHTGPNKTRFGKASHPKYKVKTKNPCEIGFVKLLNGKIPATAMGNPAINMWDERFLAENLLNDVLKVNDKAGRLAFLEDLVKIVHKDQIFVDNLSSVVNMMLREDMIHFKDVQKLFLNRTFNNASFFYSHTSKELAAKINVDPSKLSFINDLIHNSGLSKTLKKEYKNILLHSNRTTEELELAIKSGMKLRNDIKSMKQFKKYMEFLDPAKPKKVVKGLKNIEKIYDFNFNHKLYTLEMLQSPEKQFLAQKSRLKSFEQKRLKELEFGLKTQQDPTLYKKWNTILQREKMGLDVDKSVKRKLKKQIDEIQLNKQTKTRAAHHAAGEKSIYRKMLNGCNSGESKRLESAKKKFVKFKLAMSLAGTPFFYSLKNWDKRKTDPAWMERLGYEWAIGLAFTVVGNKIVTNGNTSFMRKYLEGYAKFSALDGINAYGYDALFGKKSYIRYFQQIYNGKDLEPSQIEKEFEELKKSDTFKDDFASLTAYVDERSKENNTKNFLAKHLNLNTYSSSDDERITQEDLETQEGREVMMELLAERMYLQNMGNWPLFQTGNTGMDRWSFYRMRNIVWDMKGLALNLALFQIMCREPLGKIGSWGLILGLYLGDMMFSGDITYGMRRDAINQ